MTKSINNLLIILIILCVSFLFRYPHLYESIWMDEGYTFLAAKNYLESGLFQMPSGVPYGEGSKLFIFLESQSLNFFGENELGLRIPALVLGTIFPIFIYSFLYLYLKRSFILSATITLLLTISSWEISWSTQGRYYMMVQFFYIFNIYILYIFSQYLYKNIYINTKISTQNILISIILFLSSFLSTLYFFNTHSFGKIIFLLSFLWIVFLTYRVKYKRVIQILPILLFFFFIIIGIILTVINIPHNTWKYINYFATQHSGLSILFLISILLFSIARIFQKKKNLNNFLFWTYLSIIIPFFSISLAITPIAYRYLFAIYPLLIIFSIIVLYNFFISKYKKKHSILFLFILFIFLFQEYNKSFNKKIFLESDISTNESTLKYTPQPDFKSAFQFINNNNTTDDKIITSNPEIAYFYKASPNKALPFDWQEQKDWRIVQQEKPEYANIEYFYSLRSFSKYTSQYSGYIILDGYALQKMPKRIQEYIYQNFSLIFEKRENEYSLILIYKF